VLADRYDRTKVLAATQIGSALCAAALASLGFTHTLELWHLIAVSAGFGALWSVNNPNRHALIPHLVPRQDLMNAIALNSTGFNLTRSLGPAVGGLLLAAFGFSWVFTMVCAAYLLVMLTTLNIRTHTRTTTVATESVLQNLKTGLVYVRQHRTVATLVVMGWFIVIIGMPYFTMLALFARDVYEVSERGYGFLLGCTGIGSIAASIYLASQTQVRNPGTLQIIIGLALGIGIIGFGLAPSFALAIPGLILAGAASMMYLSLNNSILQMTLPDAVRGRVMGLVMMQFGLMPLGSLVATSVADVIGLQATVITMGAILGTVALLAMHFLKDFRRLDLYAKQPELESRKATQA
jgi:MFS family permease